MVFIRTYEPFARANQMDNLFRFLFCRTLNISNWIYFTNYEFHIATKMGIWFHRKFIEIYRKKSAP